MTTSDLLGVFIATFFPVPLLEDAAGVDVGPTLGTVIVDFPSPVPFSPPELDLFFTLYFSAFY